MIYTYEVVNSTYPQVPVGTHLVDRRRELSYTWDILDRNTGEHMWFTGKRGHRACNVCYSRGKVMEHGHDGDHIEPADAAS